MSSPASRIAITGMAGRFPGARNVDEFWSHLCAGKESIERFTLREREAGPFQDPPHAAARLVLAAGVLDDADVFDAEFFNISPREAELMDPQHRILLECAWEALEDAAYCVEDLPDSVGVFAGCGTNLYLFNLMSNLQAIRGTDPRVLLLANEKDYLATRISYRLGLRGPAVTVQTACSTSLVAVHLAVQSLLSGECDIALAGGVSLRIPQRAGYYYVPGSIESSDGHCRAFDAAADGTVSGSGAGLVVLRRLHDAERARDRVCAVIRGSAINNNGNRAAGFTAPSVQGQTAVIAEALEVAGVSASEVRYVEAHGTATALGDPIEVAALAEAFGGGAPGNNCIVGSVKSNIGHLDAAAGIAGLIKTVLILQTGTIPATLHYKMPNPDLRLAETPFCIHGEAMNWPIGSGGPRLAGVSSFGIGGTNAHVVLEQASEVRGVNGEGDVHVLPISARTPAALHKARLRMADWLEQHSDLSLGDVAFTLQNGRARFSCRSAVTCGSLEEAVRWLRCEDNKGAPTCELARRWEAGEAVDWSQSEGLESAGRVRLPAYSFERKRYWIDYVAHQPPTSEVTEEQRPAEVEQTLRAMWRQVLGTEAEIPQGASFFDLNGDSLVATQLMSRIQEEFGCAVPLGDFFDDPTVDALAKLVRRSQGEELQGRLRLSPAPRGSSVASFAQQRLWFIDRLRPGNPAFNIVLAIRATGLLDCEALSRAVSEIVRRHEVLRMSFADDGGTPVPILADHTDLRIPQRDLSVLSWNERSAEFNRLCRDEAQRAFDLRRGPLAIFQLARMQPAEHVLIISVHHVVFDVWASAVFFGELAALYTAFRDGLPSPLPPLQVQYSDFAYWQRQLYEEGHMADHESFWKVRLANLPRTVVPPDLSGNRRDNAGACEERTVPAGLSASVRERASESNATPFMVLLTAYCIVLQQRAGGDQVVLGTDIANRNHPLTESMIGFLVNQLVLRIDFSGNPDTAQMIERTRETSLEAFAHQDYPFDRLVEALRPARAANEAPLFGVKFVMRNVRMPDVNVEGIRFEPVTVPRYTTTFDFVLTAIDDGDSMTLGLDYSTALYSPECVREFLADYLIALEMLCAKESYRAENISRRIAAVREQRLAEGERERAQRIRMTQRRPVVVALHTGEPQ